MEPHTTSGPPGREPAALPTSVRAVAGLAAALAASYSATAVQTLATQDDPLPITATVLVLVVLPGILLFGGMALLPDRARDRIRGWTGADIARPLHALAVGLATVAVLVVLGMGSIVETAYGLENLLVHGKSLSELSSFTERQILRQVGLNLVVFLVPPVAWSLWVDGDTPEAARDRLGLRVGDPIRGLGLALALVVGSFLLLGALAGALHLLGIQPPDNERALALGKALTIPSAIAVSASAALGEELFFRGWLQVKLGNLAQAGLFSLAHLSYLNLLEAVVTFGLGLAFGLARERTDSLLAPMLAHFGFNALTFVAIMYA